MGSGLTRHQLAGKLFISLLLALQHPGRESDFDVNLLGISGFLIFKKPM